MPIKAWGSPRHAEVINYCIRKVAGTRATRAFTGFGALVFEEGRNNQLRVSADHDGADWLDEAWDMAKDAFDRRAVYDNAMTHQETPIHAPAGRRNGCLE